MKKLARKNILKITPYIAGKPIEETKRELGLRQIIKLASNENPLGPSPKAIRAIKKCLVQVNRYPDSEAFYLKTRLAKELEILPENLLLGNGSDELIDIIIKTFVEEGENIITADITFLEYEIISNVIGRKVIKVPLKNFKYDLPVIKGRINKKTKLVFISNPNNPTGTYVNKDEIKDFLKGLPKNVLVILDEAYDTFIDVKDFPRGLEFMRKNKNVVVLKTFSKAFGLAGLRVGYAVASPEVISCMEKARQPFNVNSLAQAGALGALGDRGFLKRTRKLVWEGKRYLYRELDKLSLSYVQSVANFILIDVGRDGFNVFKEMLKNGVIIRDMKQYGLNNFIRVTIGTREENKKFIQVFKRAL